jgi:hypothetical protein
VQGWLDPLDQSLTKFQSKRTSVSRFRFSQKQIQIETAPGWNMKSNKVLLNVALLSLTLLPVSGQAQGKLADYERANGLRKTIQDAAIGVPDRANWIGVLQSRGVGFGMSRQSYG